MEQDLESRSVAQISSTKAERWMLPAQLIRDRATDMRSIALICNLLSYEEAGAKQISRILQRLSGCLMSVTFQ
jgi:hypothetical protein